MALTPEACLQKALEVACDQQAKLWELRAAVSLAKLWQSQNKRQKACDLLAPVYGWFTEGFDTGDFQEAKGLLDELRAYQHRLMTSIKNTTRSSAINGLHGSQHAQHSL